MSTNTLRLTRSRLTDDRGYIAEKSYDRFRSYFGDQTQPYTSFKCHSSAVFIGFCILQIFREINNMHFHRHRHFLLTICQLSQWQFLCDDNYVCLDTLCLFQKGSTCFQMFSNILFSRTCFIVGTANDAKRQTICVMMTITWEFKFAYMHFSDAFSVYTRDQLEFAWIPFLATILSKSTTLNAVGYLVI